MIKFMPEGRKEGRMEGREEGKKENIRASREATFTREEMLALPAGRTGGEAQTGRVPRNDSHKDTKWPGRHVAPEA